MEQMYIDKVLLIKIDNSFLIFEGDDITAETLETMKDLWDLGELERIEIENTEDCKSLVIFSNNRLFHVGIVDMFNDENSFIDDGSEDMELIEIAGNMFAKRNITDDKAGVWKVIETFILSGDMADQFNWYTE